MFGLGGVWNIFRGIRKRWIYPNKLKKTAWENYPTHISRWLVFKHLGPFIRNLGDNWSKNSRQLTFTANVRNGCLEVIMQTCVRTFFSRIKRSLCGRVAFLMQPIGLQRLRKGDTCLLDWGDFNPWDNSALHSVKQRGENEGPENPISRDKLSAWEANWTACDGGEIQW